MNPHDLTLFALGGTAGAYAVILVGLLLSLRDDHRKDRAELAAIPTGLKG